MDRATLTPPQLRVVDELLELGGPRPTFAPDISVRLVDALESALHPVVAPLGTAELLIGKRTLGLVLACEAHHVAAAGTPFPGWSVTTARGTVAHKAIELAVHLPAGTPPLTAVDGAFESFAADDGDRGPGRWLADATAVEVAELRGEVNDLVVKFQECWPPLRAAWRPRTESSTRVELCDRRVLLAGRVDLALGMARGAEARVLVVDLKTGRGHGAHLDDLRFYALLHTIRTGVPPFRVASYYLDAGAFAAEDVTEELLFDVAVPRVVDGVTRVVELHLGERPPRETPGPVCAWCPRRTTCDTARRANSDLDDTDVVAAGLR